MKIPLSVGAPAPDEAVAAIDPHWRSRQGARGGHVAATAPRAVREGAAAVAPVHAPTTRFGVHDGI
ncbi:hypothetical protein ABZ446_10495 [Streptomyces sp. NPDC005813]|uniref:hypothetical protein n=1 Tax=Streptomyces sp. NPDC005813 TaxID=3155592 RepID=UPI0033EBF20D